MAGATGLRHAWDFFGRADTLGTLNFLTPERRRGALAAVRSGRTVGLSLPLDAPDPPSFGRGSLQHEVHAVNSFSWEDRITWMDPQASSQWDGFLHVGHRDVGLYGGRPGPPESSDALGIHNWAEVGIIGRGLLLDVEAYLVSLDLDYDPTRRFDVEPHHLEAVLAAQESSIEPGDILCLRFGWHRGLAARPKAERDRLSARPECAGLSAAEDMASFLWDHQVSAVVTDNPTVEVQPGDRAIGFLHHRLLTMLGMPLGELFDLDGLASECRIRRAWDFVFISVPLNVPGGVASPGNAVALI